MEKLYPFKVPKKVKKKAKNAPNSIAFKLNPTSEKWLKLTPLYSLPLSGVLCPSSWTVRFFDVVVYRCLESALRRCELRHSVTLKAELRRSIEVVLAWKHFVADLSTWFREVTDLSAASFCLWRPEWWHTGIVNKKLRLSRSLPFFLSTMLSNYAPFFLEKKERKRQREALPAVEKTDMCAF